MATYPPGVPVATVSLLVDEFIAPGTDVRFTILPDGGEGVWVTAGTKYIKLESVAASGSTLPGVTTTLNLDLPVLSSPRRWKAKIEQRPTGDQKAAFQGVLTKDFIVDPTAGGTTLYLAALTPSGPIPVTSNVLTTAQALEMFQPKGAVTDTNGGTLVLTSANITDFATAVDSRISSKTFTASKITDFTSAVDARINGTNFAAARVTDLTETVQDMVAAMVVAGSGMGAAYDDGAGKLTLSSTGGGSGITSVVANTLAPGAAATASLSGGVLTLGIPRGADGTGGTGSTLTTSIAPVAPATAPDLSV